MSDHYLTTENLLKALPTVLQNDSSVVALAESIAHVLEKRLEEIRSLSIYASIDELPEDLLDILAHDFKVDWWDKSYTVEQKRKTLKDSWKVHRKLGTKAAVETAISAIYPNTRVREWWEYGGEPYHFMIMLDSTFENVDADKHQRVIQKIDCYKNLRSVLDGVVYYDAGGTVVQYFGAAFLGSDTVDGATAFKY